jgi:hypothetical protein
MAATRWNAGCSGRVVPMSSETVEQLVDREGEPGQQRAGESVARALMVALRR